MFSTLPTKIAGVLYLIFVVLFVVVFALHTNYWKPLLIILLISIPYALINIYDIDCVFSGNCNIWGWIKGICFIIYLVFTILLTILLLADFQNTINTDKETTPVITTTNTTTNTTTKDNNDYERKYPITYYNPGRSNDPGGNGTYNNSNVYTSRSNLNANYINSTNNQLKADYYSVNHYR